MPHSQDYEELYTDYNNMKQEIRNILNRFKLYGTCTQHDYDCAMGDIREIVG
jgi:hypothetical protein